MEHKRYGPIIIGGLIPGIVFLLVFSLLLFGGIDDDGCLPGAQQSAVTVDPSTVPTDPIAGYGHEQLVNAAYIIEAGYALNLSVRDQAIGVMTAMGEAGLRVIDYGDFVGPDSRGLFQQRDNGAWGSYEDRMDPFISATNFFRALMQIEDRDTLAPTIVAHRVQINADPYHYERYWPAAVQVVQGLAGVQTVGIGDTPAPSSRYQLGDVQWQTQIVADLVGPMFGIKTIGGYRESAIDPGGHPSGLALDFMIDDIPNGSDVGQRLADYLEANAATLGVDYIIWEQHWWSADNPEAGWRAMEDRGSISANHYDHVHLNIRADASPNVPTECTPGLPGTLSPDGWSAPSAGPVTSHYGLRKDPVTGGFTILHQGTDLLGGGAGGPIWAVQDGVVSNIFTDSYGGWGIDVDHGSGVMTRYKHMWPSGIHVVIGSRVAAGQHIADVGSSGWATGPHLHFEIHVNGSPVDPVPFMADVGVPLG